MMSPIECFSVLFIYIKTILLILWSLGINGKNKIESATLYLLGSQLTVEDSVLNALYNKDRLRTVQSRQGLIISRQSAFSAPPHKTFLCTSAIHNLLSSLHCICHISVTSNFPYTIDSSFTLYSHSSDIN